MLSHSMKCRKSTESKKQNLQGQKADYCFDQNVQYVRLKNQN